MASWGTKLYQNDISEDVRNYYQDQLKRGKSNEEITRFLIENYQVEINDIDDAPNFWFALADAQWDLGRLLPEVKENALKYLHEELNSKKTNREKTLDSLLKKITSPMPTEKKISKYNLYKCEWKIGDVFAYKIDSDYAKEKGLYGRYFLLQKVDEGIWYPGHIVPIVYVKITESDKLPRTEEEYNGLEYVQIACTNYEDRFLPLDVSRSLEEQIVEKSKNKYEVDEYGFLPQYRLELANTSKTKIPKKLIFISNFENVQTPKNEFIPSSKLSISAFVWKFFDKLIIDSYVGHNMREYEIYSTKNHKS